MTIQDTKGNLHGQDGRFTQKPLQPGQDLDATAPFNPDGGDTRTIEADRLLAEAEFARVTQTSPWTASKPDNLEAWRQRIHDNPPQSGVFRVKREGTDTVLECVDSKGDLDCSEYPARMRFRPDGSLEAETWCQNGQLHRDNAPASIVYYPDGTPRSESWYRDGVLHREDEPAASYYTENGVPYQAQWRKHGAMHRDSGMPADITTSPYTGRIMFVSWYENNRPHRVDGPAVLMFNNNGGLESETWCRRGQSHRKDGPAHVKYYPDGGVSRENWYYNGEQHRLDGPAVTEYWDTGVVSCREWWRDGKYCNPNGPAWVNYHQDGIVKDEGYVDEQERVVAVAYRSDGSVESREWLTKDRDYREDRPAVEDYRPDGSLETAYWWRNEQLVPEP